MTAAVVLFDSHGVHPLTHALAAIRTLCLGYMALLNTLNAIQGGRFGHPGAYEFRKCEIWTHKPDSEGRTNTFMDGDLLKEEFSEWVGAPVPTHASVDESRPITGGLKLLYINQKGHNREDDSSTEDHDLIRGFLKDAFTAFHLNLSEEAGLIYNLVGWRRYQSAAFADSLDQDNFISRYHLEWSSWRMIWAHKPRSIDSPSVNYCIFSYSQESSMAQQASKLVEQLQKYAANPMFPALVSAFILITRMVNNISASEDELGEVSEGTGFQAWENEYNEAFPNLQNSDFISLSRKASAVASENAHHQFRLRLLKNLMHDALEENGRFHDRLLRLLPTADASDSSATRLAYTAVNDSIRHLLSTCEELTMFSATLQSLASIQLTVIFNLIAQHDQNLNITIARDSRTLAIESKRDSSSMVSIAAVTIFFLPGTFVASFFAMPLLKWDAPDGHVVNTRFRWYWAVTIPLTFFTMATWLVWYVLKAKRQHQEDVAAQEEIGKLQSGKEDEKPVGSSTSSSADDSVSATASVVDVNATGMPGSRKSSLANMRRSETGLSAVRYLYHTDTDDFMTGVSRRGTGHPSSAGMSKRGTGLTRNPIEEGDEEDINIGSRSSIADKHEMSWRERLRRRMDGYRTHLQLGENSRLSGSIPLGKIRNGEKSPV